MLHWHDWGSEPFARAQNEGKPVLLSLISPLRRSSREMERILAAPELERLLGERFVCVRVDASERPDLLARYGEQDKDAGLATLSTDGRVLGRIPLGGTDDLHKSLRESADSYKPKPEAPAPEMAAWTGAVGPSNHAAGPAPDWPSQVLSRVKALQHPFPCLDCLELLLYGAREWKDSEALKLLMAKLSRLCAGSHWDAKAGGFSAPDAEKGLALNARLARIYWDAHSLTGAEDLGRIAEQTMAFMTRELYAPLPGAFRDAADRKAYHADANAMAALACFKASVFVGGGQGKKYRWAADEALVFLARLYDPTRGMAHAWTTGPRVFGLLADSAWAMSAFCESFLMWGHKPHREFADALLRHLFQEIWERERGGFLDRPASREDIGELKKPLTPIAANAVAFEAAWRLHQVKGNPNYRKWLEWGLKRLIPEVAEAGCEAAALARISDIVSRGRFDLELVGRIGDPKRDALLAALHRHYLPRKIISFVDPDDQDYILAHRLDARAQPRLYGCVDLRPKGFADNPEQVGELLKSLDA